MLLVSAMSWLYFREALRLMSWKILTRIHWVQLWRPHWGTLSTQQVLRECMKLPTSYGPGFKDNCTAKYLERTEVCLVCSVLPSLIFQLTSGYYFEVWKSLLCFFFPHSLAAALFDLKCDHQLLERHLCRLIPFSRKDAHSLWPASVTWVLLLFLVIASKIIAHVCVGVCVEGFLQWSLNPS